MHLPRQTNRDITLPLGRQADVIAKAHRMTDHKPCGENLLLLLMMMMLILFNTIWPLSLSFNF